MTPMTQKRVKNDHKSAIMDHILLEGNNAACEDFSILISRNNQFKLHLKESLLIKTNKPELNRTFFTLQRFLHYDISYSNVFLCIIRIIVLLTISYFYENLDNSSSLYFENASSVKQNVIPQKKNIDIVNQVVKLVVFIII